MQAPLQYTQLVRCHDNVAVNLWVLTSTIADADAIVVYGDVCYYYSDIVSLTPGTIVETAEAYGNCADCEVDHPWPPHDPHPPYFPCDADVAAILDDPDSTADEKEGQFPGVHGTFFGVVLCSCFSDLGSNQSTKFIDSGFNGHDYTLTPGGVFGRCRSYQATGIYWPAAGAYDADHPVGGYINLSDTTCADPWEFRDRIDYFDYQLFVTLCCEDEFTDSDGNVFAAGWYASGGTVTSSPMTKNCFNGDWVSQGVGPFPWAGHGGVVAVVENGVTKVPGCTKTGEEVGPAPNECGSGRCIMIATAPGA